MTILHILTDQDPRLHQKSKEIKDFQDPVLQGLIADMRETLKAAKGIGLAAPQVGQNQRLIVVRLWNEEYIVINPRLTYKSREKESGEEGCLSLPGVYLDVVRAAKVRVKGFDTQGKKIKVKAKGLLARALQHEIDHLDGILIKDKANVEAKA